MKSATVLLAQSRLTACTQASDAAQSTVADIEPAEPTFTIQVASGMCAIDAPERCKRTNQSQSWCRVRSAFQGTERAECADTRSVDVNREARSNDGRRPRKR